MISSSNKIECGLDNMNSLRNIIKSISFDKCQEDLLTLRNVHKARFSVDTLLLADYAATMGKSDYAFRSLH